jgi:hypothetical protein
MADGVPVIEIVPDVAFPLNTAVHPAGKPVGRPIPVAIVVACVIAAGRESPIQRVGVEDAAPTVRLPVTTIEPVANTSGQPVKPIIGTEKLKVFGVTLAATVPETVKTLAAHVAVNPAGSPVGVPMLVAPVVAYEIAWIVPPKQTVWLDGADIGRKATV